MDQYKNLVNKSAQILLGQSSLLRELINIELKRTGEESPLHDLSSVLIAKVKNKNGTELNKLVDKEKMNALASEIKKISSKD